MPSGNSSRRRRGPKPSRCPRAATPDCNLTRSTSSSSTSATSSAQSSRNTSNFSAESSLHSSRTDVTNSTVRTSLSVISLGNDCNFLGPDLTINHGDSKKVYDLSDKGKMVIINRKNGEIVYMLRCVDGRRVFIEKSDEGASLIMTNQRGKVVKALSGRY